MFTVELNDKIEETDNAFALISTTVFICMDSCGVVICDFLIRKSRTLNCTKKVSIVCEVL